MQQPLDQDGSAPAGTTPSEPRQPLSIDRYLPFLAIAAMIATFVVLPPSFAMTMVAAIWLVGTRISPGRRLLGLSLTEALAWLATIAIVEFVAVLVLYIVSGSLGG